MGFGENLKSARKSCGYTQQQIADLMKIDKSTYCGYERGKRQPDVQKIKQLSEILGISGDALLETGYEKAPTTNGERSISNAELKFALWGDCEDVSDDDLADVLRYAAFVRERKKDK